MQKVLRQLLTLGMILAMLFMMAGAQELFGQGAMPPWFWPAFPNATGSGPAALGFVCTTESGGNIPLFTYQNLSLTLANQNPIRLNAAGRAVNGVNEVRIFLLPQAYRFSVHAPGTGGGNCNGVPVGVLLRQVDDVENLAQLLEIDFNPVIVDNMVHCAQYPGANAGQKIAACLAALPATGGSAYASFEGAQTITVCPFTGITKPVTLIMGGGATYTLSANCTLPANINVMWGQGNIISVNGGSTLTYLGGMEGSSASRHFSDTRVSFVGNTVVGALLPQWWGATGDGTTDDTTALQNVITVGCAVGANKTIHFRKAVYKFSSSSTMVPPDDCTVEGENWDTMITTPDAMTGNTAIFQPASGVDFRLVDIYIKGPPDHATHICNGISHSGGGSLTFDWVKLTDMDVAIKPSTPVNSVIFRGGQMSELRNDGTLSGIGGSGSVVKTTWWMTGILYSNIGSTNQDHGMYIEVPFGDVLIQGNRVFNISGSFVQMQAGTGGTGTSNGVVINDNIIVNAGTSGGGALIVQQADNYRLTVTGNEFTGTLCVNFAGSTTTVPAVFSGNVFRCSTAITGSGSAADNALVANNRIYCVAGCLAMSLSAGMTGWAFNDNTVTMDSAAGGGSGIVEVSGATDLSFKHNTFILNNLPGLWFSAGADRITSSDNSFYGSGNGNGAIVVTSTAGSGGTMTSTTFSNETILTTDRAATVAAAGTIWRTPLHTASFSMAGTGKPTYYHPGPRFCADISTISLGDINIGRNCSIVRVMIAGVIDTIQVDGISADVPYGGTITVIANTAGISFVTGGNVAVAFAMTSGTSADMMFHATTNLLYPPN